MGPHWTGTPLLMTSSILHPTGMLSCSLKFLFDTASVERTTKLFNIDIFTKFRPTKQNTVANICEHFDLRAITIMNDNF